MEQLFNITVTQQGKFAQIKRVDDSYFMVLNLVIQLSLKHKVQSIKKAPNNGAYNIIVDMLFCDVLRRLLSNTESNFN
jgi:hypothetical protein